MNSATKVRLIIVVYCVALWVTNWSYATSYDREFGLTSRSVDLRGLGALLGGLVTFVCFRRLWRLIREFLALGVHVPSEAKIWGEWWMLWFLLPLAFGLTNKATDVADDGTLATTVFQYGGGWPSACSIAFSASAIMLFQSVVRLEAYCPHKE